MRRGLGDPEKRVVTKKKRPFRYAKDKGVCIMAVKDQGKWSKNTVVSTTELAGILGLSVRRIQQLIQDGKLVTVGGGKLNLADAVQDYIGIVSVSEEKAKRDKALEVANATLRGSKARIAKMEADELEGKMHRSEDVMAMTEELVYTVRSSLLALPGRCAVDYAACESAAEAAQLIRQEVHKIMAELANFKYDRKKYLELARNRQNWDLSEDDDD